MSSLILRPNDLNDIPFAVQAQLAELPQEAQRDFLMEYSRRKKELPVAYIAHFVSLSEGYLDNWTLQIFFWLSWSVGIGPFWWFFNLFRMPGKVHRHNKTMATKVLKFIHYKYQIAGKGMVNSLKGKLFEAPGTLLAKQTQSQQVRLRPWKVFDTNAMGLDILNLGGIFDYKTETWEVVSEGQYDWEDGNSEKVFKMQQIADVNNFLLFVKKEYSYLSLLKASPINIYALNEGLEMEIQEKKRPFNVLTYQGRSYFREYTTTGYMFNLGDKMPSPTEVVSWTYFDESRQYVLRIEKHGRQSFKAFIGQVVISSEFTDIAPRNK